MDAHSGIFGGKTANAAEALSQIIALLIPPAACGGGGGEIEKVKGLKPCLVAETAASWRLTSD
jgi:hypothetical protein